MKKEFRENLILKVPNFENRFVVHVDCCSKGIGGCVSRFDEKGDLRSVAFNSKKFTETDRVRSIYEIDFISLVKTISRFRHFLRSEFDVYTDNRALSWILNTHKRMLKYGAQVEPLSQFSFKI